MKALVDCLGPRQLYSMLINDCCVIFYIGSRSGHFLWGAGWMKEFSDSVAWKICPFQSPHTIKTINQGYFGQILTSNASCKRKDLGHLWLGYIREKPKRGALAFKCSLSYNMQQYRVRIWAMILHALDVLFLWALLYRKCPRSLSLQYQLFKVTSCLRKLFYPS